MLRITCLLLVASLITTGLAAAADETGLEVGPQGLVTIVFPDGVRAEMYPVVEGLRWAYSDCRSGQITQGEPLDLAGEGLTVRVPIRGSAPGHVDILGRLQVDPEDEHLVRFSYQFTAPEAAQLNCARLTFRLPIEPYRGQAVTTIEGPAMKVDKLPVDPLAGGHLLNASAKGAAIAEDQPHGLRVDLDAPQWCILDDSRRWTGVDEYSLQLCALVSADGTTLAAGQAVSVAGTVRFGSKVRVQAAAPQATSPLSFAGLRADVTNPWFPRLANAEGTTLLSVDLMQLGQPESMHPEPQGEAATDAATGTVTAAARLYADAKREAYFDVVRRFTSTPESLCVRDDLVAHGSLRSFGVVLLMSLDPRLATEGGYAVAFTDDPGHEPPFPLAGGAAKAYSAIVPGVCLQTTAGRAVVALTGDPPRRWVVLPGLRTAMLMERAVEVTRPVCDDGSTFSHTLTIRWGQSIPE